MYRVVRRWAGPAAGLLAAGIFAATPIAASMFGHSMEDGALTMCLVLAADSWQRAVMEGRLRSLCWAGVWVGLGFQAKMLQAWIILPALGLGYLLAAPGGLIRRLGQLGVAGLVMLAVSLSWIALYTFTPAADRPYVDGSTNNSAVAMVFGYNGVERFGISFPGSVASFGGGGGGGPVKRVAPATGRGAGQEYNAGGFLGRSGGWTKLVSDRFGPEIGWLYPLALLSLVAGLAWRGRARRTDPVRAGLVMWGGWLVTFGVIYSVMSNIPHTAYMASLAPPLAALSGAGIVYFWRWYRPGSWAGWLLPAAVVLELVWANYLWSGFRDFLPWVLPTAIGLGAAAVVVMVAGRLSRGPGAPWWGRGWPWGWRPCWRRRRRGRRRCWTAGTRVARSTPARGRPEDSGRAAVALGSAAPPGRLRRPPSVPRVSREAERPAPTGPPVAVPPVAGSPAASEEPVSRAVSARRAAWPGRAVLAAGAASAGGSSAAPA
jgi:4-amino-4-deoxy-L-arabinose transferase-like glycosyltransferase